MRLRAALVALCLLVGVGTLGYWSIEEDYDLFDGFFMTWRSSSGPAASRPRRPSA